MSVIELVDHRRQCMESGSQSKILAPLQLCSAGALSFAPGCLIVSGNKDTVSDRILLCISGQSDFLLQMMSQAMKGSGGAGGSPFGGATP